MGGCVRYYRSKAGDTADLIAWRVYERQDARLVELLIDANPGLCEHGPILPAGVLVNVPDAEEPAAASTGVRLWG